MFDFKLTRDQFLEHHYEREPLIARGALRKPSVRWQDIESALFGWDVADGRLRLFRDGPLPLDSYTEAYQDVGMQRSRMRKDVLYRELAAGATLVMNRLESRSEAVHDIAMHLARFVGEKTVANGYVAFGGGGSFQKHWDTHDVFAVQLQGRKRWRVWAPSLPLPLPHQTSAAHKSECPDIPAIETTLEAGDVLYLPRGYWHEAVPLEGEPTLHVAVGVHPMHIAHYLCWLVEERLPRHPEFRMSLKAEKADVHKLEWAVDRVVQEFRDPANLRAFKSLCIAGTRTDARFDFSRFTADPAPFEPDAWRLNSPYRLDELQSFAVNGAQMHVDTAPNRTLRALLQGERVECGSADAAERTLLQRLVHEDIVGTVRFDTRQGLA